jgi:tetratricopeptide (TPR) repeat protein
VRYFARDYASAIAEYRAVLDQAPDFALGWALLGRVYLVQGRSDSALATLSRAVQLSQGDPSYQAVHAAALALAGRPREGRALADSLRRAPDDGYIPFCELASAYLYLGDHDTALALFARGIDALDPATKHMAVEPLYDRVRGDARFVALLARLGLAPSRTES